MRPPQIEVDEQYNKLRLSLQSQVAQSYFTLRYFDEENRIVGKAVENRETNLQLSRKRFANGLSTEFEIAGSEADLAMIKAGKARLAVPRHKLENAIGFLLGVDPSCFEIEPAPLAHCLPKLNKSVPVSVLKNRPDVAAAIERLKTANAKIDICKNTFFPSLNLIERDQSCDICRSEFLSWSKAAFCCELKEKRYPKKAIATQKKALLDFQMTVLEAFHQVDDSLATIAALETEREAQQLAVDAANQIAKLSREQFDEGLANSTDVANTERGQLAARRSLIQIKGQQCGETIKLLESLGGGTAKTYFSSDH